MVVCAILGGVVGYLVRKFVEKSAVMLLGAIAGGAILFFIMS